MLTLQNMTKYVIGSLDKPAYVQLDYGWTPETLEHCSSICTDDLDAEHFSTMTEALLALFVLDARVPKLTRGMNFIVVPIQMPDPQLYLRM